MQLGQQDGAEACCANLGRHLAQVSERMVLAQKAYILFYIQRQAPTTRLPAFLSSAAAPLLPASSTAWTGYTNGASQQQQQQQHSPSAASRSSRRAASKADDSASASPRGRAREANGYFRPEANGDAGVAWPGPWPEASLRGGDGAAAAGRTLSNAQPADGEIASLRPCNVSMFRWGCCR